MKRAWFVVLALCSACSCNEKPAPPLSSLKPAPLPQIGATVASDGGLDREAAFHVADAGMFGEGKTPGATRVVVRAKGVELDRLYDFDAPELTSAVSKLAGKRAQLSWEEDAYLAQVGTLFAALDDAGVEVELCARTFDACFSPVLRDEKAFNAWLEEPKPGKLRIVQRADGLELQTNMGKLPNAVDPNGPTIPLRGGQLDIATLRQSLGRVKAHFKNEDVCLLPSFGTELDAVAQVMAGTYAEPGEPILSLCLVYPRPMARDH